MPIGTHFTFPLGVKNIDTGTTIAANTLFLLQSSTISAARTTVSGTTFTNTGLVIPKDARIQDLYVQIYAPMTATSIRIGTAASVVQFFTADMSVTSGGVDGPAYATRIWQPGAFTVMETSMAADTTIEVRVSISGTTNPAGGAFIVRAVCY